MTSSNLWLANALATVLPPPLASSCSHSPQDLPNLSLSPVSLILCWCPYFQNKRAGIWSVLDTTTSTLLIQDTVISPLGFGKSLLAGRPTSVLPTEIPSPTGLPSAVLLKPSNLLVSSLLSKPSQGSSSLSEQKSKSLRWLVSPQGLAEGYFSDLISTRLPGKCLTGFLGEKALICSICHFPRS